MQKTIRSVLMPIAAAMAIGVATPSLAYDSGGLISMQRALDVATDLGG
jgi:hypothetical protein